MRPEVVQRRGDVEVYETICAQCLGDAIAIHEGSLWCWACLEPLIRKGEAFRPSIVVRKAAG